MTKNQFTNDTDRIPKFFLLWHNGNYSIVKINGIDCLALRPSDWPRLYKPDFENEPPIMRPGKPSEWDVSPFVHLANLNIDKNEEILNFTRKWGLLGLWKVDDFKEWHPNGEHFFRLKRAWLRSQGHNEHEIESIIKKDLIYYDPFAEKFYEEYLEISETSSDSPEANSAWKRYDFTKWKNNREPLEAFKEAAAQFQGVVEYLRNEGNITNTIDNKIESVFDSYLSKCTPTCYYVEGTGRIPSWRTPSLLHLCYAMLWKEVTKLGKYIRCEYDKCNRLFLPEKNNKTYCTEACRKNAGRMKNYNDTKIAKRLYLQGYSVDDIAKEMKTGVERVKNLLKKEIINNGRND